MCFACDTLSRRGVLFALQNGQNFIDRCRLHGKFLFARFSLRCELCFCCFFFCLVKIRKIVIVDLPGCLKCVCASNDVLPTPTLDNVFDV